MADPRIPLKNPWLAAVLAYMVPGAGHFYQGRYFKGLVYSVCIIGMFLYGLQLSDWTALNLYYEEQSGGRVISTPRSWGFIAQAGIGTPVVFTLAQTRRFESAANRPLRELDGTFTAEFRGEYVDDRSHATPVVGEIHLQPSKTTYGPSAAGRFVGHAKGEGEDGELQPIELQLGGGFLMEKPVAGDNRRVLQIQVVHNEDGREVAVGTLDGTIPRSVLNRVGVPPTSERLEELHGTAGKWFELALVYTWIAGLLNILAVWDAFEGPAYGYGDEEPEDQDKPEDTPAETNVPVASAS